MTTEPLCTVVLSSFNRPVLIRDAIDSVIQQTWPNMQLLIADDYSGGPVMSVFDEYTDRIHKRTHGSMIIPPKDKPTDEERQYGQRCAVCINAAMAHADGEFVCFLPDDDFLTPKSIEARARYLIDHPMVNVVYGRLESCKSETPKPGIHYRGQMINGVGETWYGTGVDGELHNPRGCCHDQLGFWEAEPQAAIENRVDHSMFMVRRVDSLPEWPARPWAKLKEGIEDARAWGLELSDCADANFLMACRVAGLGPFHSVPDVVTVKRYGHPYGHRTDPSRRE